MRKKLTPKTIDALPPAKDKRYEVRDALIPGLLVRVSVSGGKVWYVTTRVDGRLRRIRVGRYPIVSLADAREQTREILRKVELGLPLIEPQVEEEEVTTLGGIIPEFIRLYAKPRNRDWKGTESVLTKFASLNDRPIDQIKRRDVVKVLDDIVAYGTPFRANRALAAIKKLMSWCLDRGVIEANVLAGLQPPTKEVARDRVLSDDELRACWAGADEEGFPFGTCTKLMILTGQRRSEVAGMRWSEVDLEKAIWTIPAKRAKNATLHMVPLAPLVVEMLKATPRFLGSDLVFTSNGRTAVSGFGRAKRRLDTAVQSEDWRFHDLRRTVATNMAVAGVSPHVIEAVLNHKTGIVSGVAAIYNRHGYLPEKRAALELWVLRLESVTCPQTNGPPNNTNGLGSRGLSPNLPLVSFESLSN